MVVAILELNLNRSKTKKPFQINLQWVIFYFCFFAYLQVLQTTEGVEAGESQPTNTTKINTAKTCKNMAPQQYTDIHRGASISVHVAGIAISDACVELVSTNGQTFRLMDGFGFRKIIDPTLNGLKWHLAASAESV